jgi:uncharacterized protein (TIGR04222 family)
VSGPVFLLVYALLAVAVNAWLRYDQRQREAAGPARFMDIAQDPYLLAYLHNGLREAVRLTVFSLLDRGLLEETGGSVRRARADADAFARRPIEKAALSCCTGWTEVAALETYAGIVAACQTYQRELQARQLLADARIFAERFLPFVVTLALLTGVAVARGLWAVAHGRHNIGFLLVFAAIGGIALAVAWRRRRTGLGDAALKRLKVLFANLRRRSSSLVPGGESNDAVLTAALFGLAALPADRFPFLERVFPRPKSGGGDSGGSDSGGGCSGSSDSGGGCGGCGG